MWETISLDKQGSICDNLCGDSLHFCQDYYEKKYQFELKVLYFLKQELGLCTFLRHAWKNSRLGSYSKASRDNLFYTCFEVPALQI